MRALPRVFVLLFALALAGCSSNHGLPGQAGFYDIVRGSPRFVGERFELAWADQVGGVHFADGGDFRLVQDGRDALEIGNGGPIVHLREDTPIAVQGRDSRGGFSSFWFPFFLGSMLGGSPIAIGYPGSGTSYNPPPTTPTYRYPPTDQVSRDGTLQGSVGSSKPVPPDYSRMRPAPNAVGGQSGGTGAGTAATSKDTAPGGGQSGGTGAGTAATSKGTASTGGQSGGAGTGSTATGKGGGVASSGISGGGVQGARSSGVSLGRSSGGGRTGRK